MFNSSCVNWVKVHINVSNVDTDEYLFRIQKTKGENHESVGNIES